jgi:hypothetical protein
MRSKETAQLGLAKATPFPSPFLPFWFDASNRVVPNIFWHALDVNNSMSETQWHSPILR